MLKVTKVYYEEIFVLEFLLGKVLLSIMQNTNTNKDEKNPHICSQQQKIFCRASGIRGIPKPRSDGK